MHKIKYSLTLRSLRLCVRRFHAKTQRPQRVFRHSVLFLISVFCLLSSVSAQSTGSAKGKIRNVKGETIAGVSVTARRDSRDVRTVTSDKKGEFTIDGLEIGVYNFVFDARGYASATSPKIEVRRNKTTDLGDRLILQIDRGTLIIIQGSVFFKDGRSVTGAKVEVEKINSDGTTRSFPAIYTNIYGEFNFRQPEGAAKFRFTAKYKDKTASKDIEVEAAAVYRLAISLDLTRQEK